MSNHMKLAAALLCSAGIALTATSASAMPATHALALKSAAPGGIESVRWRGGWGWGLGGFAAGAIIGGALASPYYYGGGGYPYGYYPAYPAYGYGYPPPPPAYYGGPAYGGPAYGGPAYGGPAYAGPAGGGDVSYCRQRFKSYDPATGTYLGLDGQRHPCP